MSVFTCDNKDEFIFDLFPDSKHSYFVDVGASDGIYGSNTFSLEKRGWSGLCVEPHPYLSKQIEKNRECKIEESLVSDKNDSVEFLMQTEEVKIEGVSANKDELALFGGFSHAWQGGSGVVSNWNKEKIEEFSKKGKIIEKETVTLTEILEKHSCPQYIELLDIDTEGNDHKVLEGIDWSFYRFASILIEGNDEKIKEKLLSLDYILIQEFSEERLYIDNKKEGLLENAENIKNIGYWSQRVFGETCM